MIRKTSQERVVLVLQGGGALGAYQAGAFEALDRAGIAPDWISGVSIGAINAALIAGNPPKERLAALKTFWARVTSAQAFAPPLFGTAMREAFTEAAAAQTMVMGAPGFFSPRFAGPLGPVGEIGRLGYYSTEPLRRTLEELVDFDYLNREGPRLSLGAVEVETGNSIFFDSAEREIGPAHVMASGALPPGFPAVEIEGRAYWDGGLVSNTPIQQVLDHPGPDPLLVFQVDLFSARGDTPGNMFEVEQRTKDIRYSSRTRLNTDRFRERHEVAHLAERLRERLPAEFRQDADLIALCDAGPRCPVTLVHLIHRKEDFEGHAKDYEFSRLTMRDHWAAGNADVVKCLTDPVWQSRVPPKDGIVIHDFGASHD